MNPYYYFGNNEPNPTLAWSFYGSLVFILAIAGIIDLRKHIIPKQISITLLILGVLINIARGMWLGSQDCEVWKLGNNGMWIGGLDGFLFALAGFAVGFGIFFLFFALGLAGGGDVKIYGALSAWVGPFITLSILFVSTFMLFALAMLFSAGRMIQTLNRGRDAMMPPGFRKSKNFDPKQRRWVGTGFTYAPALALGTALTLLWSFRYDFDFAFTRRPVDPAPTSLKKPLEPS